LISKPGAFTISLLQELGSLVWMGRETISEIMERIVQHRAPFRLEHFFYQSNRAGVGSVRMVVLLSVFVGLTMALLTGYQLQRFGIVTLVCVRVVPCERSCEAAGVSFWIPSKAAPTRHPISPHEPRTHCKSRHGSRREGFCLAVGSPSEKHRRGYVTSERQSRKAKEPRPFGLLFFKRLGALLVGHRPTGMLPPHA
jgi:hypothetical protein